MTLKVTKQAWLKHRTRFTVFGAAFVAILLFAAVIPSFVEAALTFTEVKKLTQASPTPGGPGWFGYDVAISGDTAIGSAREPWRGAVPSGSASIFERNLGGLNNWGEVKKLVPEDDNGPGKAGSETASVAIDGDTVVVGADFENGRDGAAYIYGRNVGGPDNWGFVKRIFDADGMQTPEDDFGASVAISGDTIAVGEKWADRVHIFERDAGGPDNWGEVKLFEGAHDDTGTYDFFFQVSIEGDTLVVGSGNHTHAGGLAAAGAVYVYDRNTGGSNNWGLVKEIFTSDAAAVDQFGMTTALSGDVLIAGTSGFNSNAAYVFERNEGGPNNWGEVQKLVGSDVLASEKAIAEVGVSGDIAVLTHGSHLHSDPPTFGTAFVFERDAGGPDNWGETQELLPSDLWTWPSPSIDIDCATIIVGDQYDGATGAAYIFEASNPAGCPGSDSDNDGVPDADDLCSGTATGDSVDANGCSDAQVDSDGDGACNPGALSGGPSDCTGSDDFPNSNTDATVVIAGCDSGVVNQFVSNGANFNDLIGAISAKNHGDFVKQVTQLANQWKKDGLISGRDKGKITSCA